MSIRKPSASALGRLAIAAFLAACAPAATAPTASPAQPVTAAPLSSVAATAGPTKAPVIPKIAVTPTLRGDWIADASTVEGAGSQDPLIQVSFEWRDGIDFWISVGDAQAAQSYSAASPLDQIHLVATAGSIGCKAGDEGRYAWTRPGDGLFLHITLIEDACARRASLLARTWVHSLQAVNDGGLGIIRAGSFILGTLPDYRFAASGGDGVTDLHSFDENDPSTNLLVFDGAPGLDAPCSLQRNPVTITPTLDALVAYMDGLPGVSLGKQATKVDGYPAVHLTLTSDASIDCPNGEIAMFRGTGDATAPDYSVAPGGKHSFWVIQLPDRALVIWYEGEDVDAAAEQAFIDSLDFLDTLPTP